jgi:hypothetical protein
MLSKILLNITQHYWTLLNITKLYSALLNTLSKILLNTATYCDQLWRSNNSCPNIIQIQCRRELHQHRNCAQHTCASTCWSIILNERRIDTQGSMICEQFRHSCNSYPNTIWFQWRRDLHERLHSAQHTCASTCGPINTQWACGWILKDRWYEQFRHSCNSCPNTIWFRWRRDLHERRHSAQHTCETVHNILVIGFDSMLCKFPTAMQFLPRHQTHSMEDRFARLSALLSKILLSWVKLYSTVISITKFYSSITQH